MSPDGLIIGALNVGVRVVLLNEVKHVMCQASVASSEGMSQKTDQ